jgi:hypothetical protein
MPTTLPDNPESLSKWRLSYEQMATQASRADSLTRRRQESLSSEIPKDIFKHALKLKELRK